MSKNFEFGGAWDTADERDFLAAAIVRKELLPPDKLPSVVEFDRTAVTAKTQGDSSSCTAQTGANALEITWFNFTGQRIHIPVLHSEDEEQIPMWPYQLDVHPRTGQRGSGDYLRSAFRAIAHRSENGVIPAIDRKTGKPTRVAAPYFGKIDKTVVSFRQWIQAGFAIGVSGDVLKSENGRSNWGEAKRFGWLEFPEGWRKVTGHAISIVTAYDFSKDGEGYFTGINSYGDNDGVFKDGTFRISEHQIKNLNPSAFVVFPEDQVKLEKIKAAKNLATAIQIIRKAKKLDFDGVSAEKQAIIDNCAEILVKTKQFIRS